MQEFQSSSLLTDSFSWQPNWEFVESSELKLLEIVYCIEVGCDKFERIKRFSSYALDFNSFQLFQLNTFLNVLKSCSFKCPLFDNNQLSLNFSSFGVLAEDVKLLSSSTISDSSTNCIIFNIIWFQSLNATKEAISEHNPLFI